MSVRVDPTTDEMSRAQALPQLEASSLVDSERLEAEITSLAGHLAAAMCRWLLLIAEYDRRQAWGSWGTRSAAHWLSWQCGLTMRTAHEHVRVAHALEQLPLIREAFAAGQMSYSKVRAMTRVADPSNEAALLNIARHGLMSVTTPSRIAKPGRACVDGPNRISR